MHGATIGCLDGVAPSLELARLQVIGEAASVSMSHFLDQPQIVLYVPKLTKPDLKPERLQFISFPMKSTTWLHIISIHLPGRYCTKK